MNTPKYQHIIGFGNSCGMAAGLARLGLRENSAPFDWIMSNIRLNFTLLQNGFENFMLEENLEHHYHPLNNGQYFDKLYNIGFIHDFDPLQDAPPLSEQIGAVQEKYRRRIKYLYDSLKEPTLLVEIIEPQEAGFANEHIDELRAFLKSFHPDNDILFLTQTITDPSPYPNITLHKVGMYDEDHITGRFLFDNPELVAFLTSPETYPAEKRAKNLDFFVTKQMKASTDISFNEIRIAKENAEYESKALFGWLDTVLEGKKLTDRLVEDNVKTVVFVGISEFIRVMMPQLETAGIKAKFIAAWYSEVSEYCGLPVQMPQFKEKTEEEKEAERRKEEERKKNGEPEEHPYGDFLKHIPNLDDVDAVIAASVEMNYFLETMPSNRVRKVYSLSSIVGKESIFKK